MDWYFVTWGDSREGEVYMLEVLGTFREDCCIAVLTNDFDILCSLILPRFPSALLLYFEDESPHYLMDRYIGPLPGNPSPLVLSAP